MIEKQLASAYRNQDLNSDLASLDLVKHRERAAPTNWRSGVRRFPDRLEMDVFHMPVQWHATRLLKY